MSLFFLLCVLKLIGIIWYVFVVLSGCFLLLLLLLLLWCVSVFLLCVLPLFVLLWKCISWTVPVMAEVCVLMLHYLWVVLSTKLIWYLLIEDIWVCILSLLFVVEHQTKYTEVLLAVGPFYRDPKRTGCWATSFLEKNMSTCPTEHMPCRNKFSELLLMEEITNNHLLHV